MLATTGDFPWNPVESLRWLAVAIVAAAAVFNIIAVLFGNERTKGIRTGLNIGIVTGALLIFSALRFVTP